MHTLLITSKPGAIPSAARGGHHRPGHRRRGAGQRPHPARGRHHRRRARRADRHRQRHPGRRGRSGGRGRGRRGGRRGRGRSRPRATAPATASSPAPPRALQRSLRPDGRPPGGRAGQPRPRVRRHPPQRRLRRGRLAGRSATAAACGAPGASGPWSTRCGSGPDRVALAEPQTFMNLSGEAVAPAGAPLRHRRPAPPGGRPRRAGPAGRAHEGEVRRWPGRPQRPAVDQGPPARRRLRAGAHRGGQAAQQGRRGPTTCCNRPAKVVRQALADLVVRAADAVERSWPTAWTRP